MTHWTDAENLIGERYVARGFVARYAPGTLAFALSAALGVYLVYLRPMLRASAPPVAPVAALADANPFGSLAPVTPAPTLPAKTANPFGAIVTHGFGSSTHFAIAEAPAPLPPTPPSDLRPSGDETAPLPPRRPEFARLEPDDDVPLPPSISRTQPTARVPRAPAVANVEPKPDTTPGVFAKLFGGAPSTGREPSTTMAYAAPPPVSSAGAGVALAGRGAVASSNGGGFGGFLRGLTFGNNSGTTARYGDHVAVYDISARVVYLPDGTRLEAHSGLGSLRDDPNGVSERMRGATPPATYELSPREELFHGVAALRLTPVGSSIYGRAGLLAHTYMLGPDGDSNGCVSFRDYDAFLRAFRNGQINKLVVVTRL